MSLFLYAILQFANGFEMKFPGIDFGGDGEKQQLPQITQADKDWVDEIYGWFIDAWTYPSPESTIVLFNAENFPRTHNEQSLEALLADFNVLYAIPANMVSIEIAKDLRDTSSLDVHIEGNDMDIALETREENGIKGFVIHLSYQLSQSMDRLPYELALVFAQMHLVIADPEFESREDAYLHAHFVAVFQNFGYLLGPQLYVHKNWSNGFMEGYFRNVSPVPMPIFAYIMGLHHYVMGQELPEAIQSLPSDMRKEMELVVAYLTKHGSPLRNEKSQAAAGYYSKAFKELLAHKYDKAIDWARRSAEYHTHHNSRSDALNLLGYILLLDERYDESMQALQDALEIDPENGYALGNIACLLIYQNRLEEAEDYLNHASHQAYNDPVYLNFCQGLLLYRNNEFKESAQLFEELTTKWQNPENPIDQLEYWYALLLLDMDKKDKAIKTLEPALVRKEPKATQLMKEIAA